MRHGVNLRLDRTVEQIVGDAEQGRDAGFDFVSCPQIFGYDALTLLAVVGNRVPGIELLTAVVPTYPRHPLVLAGQALTVQAATGAQLTLGIGLSHKVVIEGMFGYSFDKPARHLREYLEVLMPLLAGEQVAYVGETLSATAMAPIDVKAPAPQVLVAALGPVMLELAGSMTDGTALWMTGPATIESHIAPTITKAAEQHGRPPPRISVGLPVCVTDDVDAARERAGRTFATYGVLPSYRAMLDREGADGPADVAIIGDEETVAARIAHVGAVGATEFTGSPFGVRDEIKRTVSLLAELAKA